MAESSGRAYEHSAPLGPRTVKDLEEETRFLKSKRRVSEFVTAITGRKEIPLKFEYLGRGAERYERIMNDAGYLSSFKEAEAIQDATRSLVAMTWRTKANLIYVGCGNGHKALSVLNEFGKTHQPLNYALVDISPMMLLKAYKNTRRQFRGPIIIRCFEWDFEEGNFAYITDYLRKNGDPVNIILFLGNTIGNLSDRARILANFRESMALNDYLLVTFHLVPRDVDKLMHAYSNEMTTQWLLTALEEVGIKREDGELKVSYNRKKQQVEVNFIVSRDTIGMFEDREVHLRKGQRVLVGTSHKFTRSEIRSLFNVAGFRIRSFKISPGSMTATVLCQPKSL